MLSLYNITFYVQCEIFIKAYNCEYPRKSSFLQIGTYITPSRLIQNKCMEINLKVSLQTAKVNKFDSLKVTMNNAYTVLTQNSSNKSYEWRRFYLS